MVGVKGERLEQGNTVNSVFDYCLQVVQKVQGWREARLTSAGAVPPGVPELASPLAGSGAFRGTILPPTMVGGTVGGWQDLCHVSCVAWCGVSSGWNYTGSYLLGQEMIVTCCLKPFSWIFWSNSSSLRILLQYPPQCLLPKIHLLVCSPSRWIPATQFFLLFFGEGSSSKQFHLRIWQIPKFWWWLPNIYIACPLPHLSWSAVCKGSAWHWQQAEPLHWHSVLGEGTSLWCKSHWSLEFLNTHAYDCM